MNIRIKLAGAVLAGLMALQPVAALAEEPKSGGNLVFLSRIDVSTLDAHFAADSVSGKTLLHIHEPLIYPGEDGVARPLLAESWTLGDDQVTWTLNLREGVSFHDDTPFDANAVKFNFDRIMNEDTGSPRRAITAAIDEVQVIDSHTVAFVTKQPYAPFINTLTMYNLAMMSPTALQEHGENYARNPVGTGPFKLKSWTSGESITLERNPDYWGGEVYLDTVEIKVVPEDSSRVISLIAGEADLISNVPPILLNRLDGDDNVQLIREDGFRTMYLGMNNAIPPFDDKRVREAVAYAVDANALVQGVLGGVGRTGGSFFSPAIPGSTDLAAREHDPEKAKALLAEAGYPDGFETTFYASPDRRQITEAIQAQLAEVGIKAQIQSPDFAAFLATLNEGDKAPMFVIGLGNPQGDPDLALSFLLSCKGRMNFWKICEENLDQAAIAQRGEMDGDKRKALLANALREVHDAIPAVVLYYEEQILGARSNVKGVKLLPNEYIVLTKVWKD